MKTLKFKNGMVLFGYEFHELDEETQNKVIYDHADFWMETRNIEEGEESNFAMAIQKAEEMRTPWFTPSYIVDYCKDEIIEEIAINQYLFDDDGELLPVRYHVNRDNEVFKTTYGPKELELEIV